jgi:hypothetical protein
MKGVNDPSDGAFVEAWWSGLVPPAPGDLWIVQALLNTIRPERGADELASPLVASDLWADRTPGDEFESTSWR